MKQTPVHDFSNPDLLAMIPVGARQVVEVGCSSGALARDYKRLNPACRYVGCDIDPIYVEQAHPYCDELEVLDIDNAPEDFFIRRGGADVWVFGDSLEHLKDPWAVLSRVRATMAKDGVVVACIPNAQHWSVQVRLATGEFRYEDAGLLDRTHLRWFTRKTILQLFDVAGFRVEQLNRRIFSEPDYEIVAPVIEELAEISGHDPKEAALDAQALQYVILARVKQ